MTRAACVWMALVALVSMPAVSVAQTRGGAATPPAPGAAPAAPNPATVKRSPGAGPLVTVTTARGSFTFETYPEEAPKSVAHITELIKRNFYNGQRISRVAPGFVVQFGDPLSRDLSKKDLWNTGGSFKIVGELEASPKRTHVVGAVALAHDGDARRSDSIMYITMREAHELDGKYNVIGKIVSGMPIVRATQIGDVIKRVSITP
jgi:peptidyl-prolyl cis-trans isomerase B (cyclophilin B)